MRQDNKTTREIALEWFTNLPFDESLNLMFKLYPTRKDFDKLTYSEKVELIYLSEHPEQAIKEESQDNSKEGITPGNWFMDGTSLESTEGWNIATLNAYAPESNNFEANARLIAQAPAMYRYIKEMAFRYANYEWIAGEAEAILSCIDNK